MLNRFIFRGVYLNYSTDKADSVFVLTEICYLLFQVIILNCANPDLFLFTPFSNKLHRKKL